MRLLLFMAFLMATLGVGGGSFPTAPSSSNLVAWYKTETLALADGAAVVTWPDSSGQGNDITQGTAGKRPTFKTGVLQGRDAVRYSNANDSCLIDATPSGLGAAGYTAYVVFKVGTWLNNALLLATNSSTAGVILSNGAAQTFYSIAHGGNGVQVDTGEGGGAKAARIVRGGWAPNTMAIYVGGVGPLSLGNSDAFSQTLICVGAHDDTDTTLNFDGDIGEVLLYNGDISASEKTTTQGYLVGRWSLPF